MPIKMRAGRPFDGFLANKQRWKGTANTRTNRREAPIRSNISLKEALTFDLAVKLLKPSIQRKSEQRKGTRGRGERSYEGIMILSTTSGNNLQKVLSLEHRGTMVTCEALPGEEDHSTHRRKNDLIAPAGLLFFELRQDDITTQFDH